VSALAQDFAIPVAHTMTGKGAVACHVKENAGLFGRYDRIANKLIDESDCLFVVGCKLGEIATKRYSVPVAGKKLIHLDIDAEELGRTYRPTVKLWGDVKSGVDDIIERLEPVRGGLAKARAGYIDEVQARMQAWRADTHARLTSNEKPISMSRLMSELNNALPSDGIFVADGGFAAHWGGLLFDTSQAGRTFVPDRGFASIGYGLPGAIGACLGAPSKPVVGLTGDGGFNMVLGELETARRMGLGITIVVVNNAASGYVKALQHLMYGKDNYQSSDLAETDYAAIATAMGCVGYRVEDPNQLAQTFSDAFAITDKPVIIDVIVTRDAAKMLPAVDNRTVRVKKGDRVA
jgi:acetolactate synthase-1/2/3 large subunit